MHSSGNGISDPRMRDPGEIDGTVLDSEELNSVMSPDGGTVRGVYT